MNSLDFKVRSRKARSFECGAMAETKLQRETRLTGSADLVAAIDATLQAMMGQKPNSVLARKAL